MEMNITSKTHLYNSTESYLAALGQLGKTVGVESIFLVSKTLVYNLKCKYSFKLFFQRKKISLSMSLWSGFVREKRSTCWVWLCEENTIIDSNIMIFIRACAQLSSPKDLCDPCALGMCFPASRREEYPNVGFNINLCTRWSYTRYSF